MNEQKILEQVAAIRAELAALRAEHDLRMRKLDAFLRQADRQTSAVLKLIDLESIRHAKLDRLLAENDGAEWWKKGEQPPWA
jgi:hypothetical protein